MYEYDSPEMTTAIKDYVGQVLSGPHTDQQRAQMISAQAAKYGVTPEQIAAATGYDAATVNKYLALAGSPSATAPTSQQISAAEQSARQSWMDGQSPDQSVFQTLFSTNANGQVVRNSDGYVAPFSLNDLQNPNAKEYYQQNPQELFALGALGGGGGQGYFKDAGVRGTTMKLGQLTPDQYYRGYTSSFQPGWDQDPNSTSYRWANQPAYAAKGAATSAPGAAGGAAGGVYGGGSQGGGSSSSFSSSGSPSLGFNLSNVAGPSEWDVAGNQTVANQLTALLASDNPLIQQARARAMQQSNARGLSNSSIAQTAGDAAAYDAMMQVARQDASTNATAAQSNTAAKNQFTTDANAFLRNGYMADYNLSANEWAAQQAYVRQREAQREQNAFNLAAMERENELNKGNTTSANSQSDRQGYINALNESRKNWAIQYKELMADPNMLPENKTSALTSLAASYNTQIKAYTGLLGWDFDKWDIEYTADKPK